MGARVGYIRVSSIDQNDQRQLEGLELDRVFTDKVSGKSLDRPELTALFEYVRDGDTVVVHSMDRLARNLDDLRQMVKSFTSKKVSVEFVKENLTFNGEDSPMSTLLLSVMGAFAEFERALIKERQAEGIAVAKVEGKYRGRKQALTETKQAEIRQKANSGLSKTALAEEYKVSRNTIYKCLK